MARLEKTVEEIQGEVSRLIHEVREVREDRSTIRVPPPTPLQGADASGCNWTMEFFGGDAAHYRSTITRAVAAVMAQWNLKR